MDAVDAELDVVVAGNSIMVFYKIYDRGHLTPVPFDPDSGVFLTLKRPGGTTLTEVAMTKIEDDPKNPVGLYRYRWQSVAQDEAGMWQARCRTVHGGDINQSAWKNAFVVA